MTPTRLQTCLSTLRWSASGVATWCGYSRQSGIYWTTGRIAVPVRVAAWLEGRMRGVLVEPPGRE